MRSGLSIRRSKSHRLACLSLYQALLKQCENFSQAAVSSNLHHLVRHRFEKNRKLRGHTQIKNALDFGYEALRLLSAAQNGSSEALQLLTKSVCSASELLQELALLRSQQASTQSPESLRQLQRARWQRSPANKANQVRRPDTTPVLERPVPQSQLHGERRVVPSFVVAQGIPFLRYGRPQPFGLSRIIRQLANTDVKRIEKHADLELQAKMATYEDDWDLIIASQFGYRDPPDFVADNGTQLLGDDGHSESTMRPGWTTWTEAVRDAAREVKRKVVQKHRERSQTANKMWAVLVKERELAAKEKEEMKMERRRRKMMLRESEK